MSVEVGELFFGLRSQRRTFSMVRRDTVELYDDKHELYAEGGNVKRKKLNEG